MDNKLWIAANSFLAIGDKQVMPILFWIDIAGLCMSILLTGSLTLLAIGFDPKNPVNRSFGFFTGAIVIWSISALLLRLSLWLEPILTSAPFLINSGLWLKFATLFIALTCIFSLKFTVNFLGRRTRWSDLALAFGILVIIALLIFSLVNQGSVVKYAQFDEYGLVRHGKSKWAWLSIGLWSSYIIWSVILFWHERHRDGAVYLALGMLILLLGLISRSALYAPFPFISFFNATSAFIMAYGVHRKQIFNPLKAYTLQLNEEIEERKKTEGLLHESEQRYRLLAENVDDVIWKSDLAFNWIYISPSFKKLTGYSHKEALNTPLPEMITPDSLESVNIVLQEELNKLSDRQHRDVSKKFEVEFIRKDGSTVWTEINAILRFDKDGSPEELYGVTRNIEDRKMAEREKVQLESQLIKAQKMEAIGTLAGGIAHDFNNILGAIIGYTELSMTNVPKENQASGYLDGILTAGNRAKDLVQQILTFSRQTEKEFKPVLVKSIVKEALKLLRASLPTTIDIRWNKKSESLVMGDPTQIHQILMNLCTNAGHAMQEKGGTLEVSLTNLEIDAVFASRYQDLKPGPYLNLTITDTGHGMPPDIIDHIFDPFFTTKGRGEGTGMGLAVVHGIVKSCGGTIHVQSDPGEGSIFKILLPVVEGYLETDKQIDEILPKGTERILLIDDEPALVEIGKDMLESLGYQVVNRTSSVEALNLFRAHPNRFDLVITDITMPQMAGDRLAEELVAIRKDILVILCTGYSYRRTEKKDRAMCIKDILMKPIVKAEIAQVVRKVLDEAKGSTQE